MEINAVQGRRPGLIVLTLSAACVLGQTSAHAQGAGEAGNISAAERSLLPEYCGATQTFARGANMFEAPDDLQRKWLGIIGPTLIHMHHYCWALVYIQRSRSPLIGDSQRRALLGRAIGDCMYVVDRAPKGFVLLPEILLRVGQANLTLGKIVEALDFFDRSRNAKPDYWPPYLEIADVNLSIGRRDRAKEVLREGLRLMPDEPRLKEALVKVDVIPAPSSQRKLPP